MRIEAIGSVRALVGEAPVRDGAGRLWIGTMGAPGTARLYRLDPGAADPVPVLDGLTVSNGIRFSPDGTRRYHADTPTGRVDVLDVSPSGALQNRRVFAETPGPGRPDGIAVDDDGLVRVAVWNGGAVLAHTPDGALAERRAPGRLPHELRVRRQAAAGHHHVPSARRPGRAARRSAAGGRPVRGGTAGFPTLGAPEGIQSVIGGSSMGSGSGMDGL